jgi:hypothetical protein
LETLELPEGGDAGFVVDSGDFIRQSDIVSSSAVYKNTDYRKNMLVVLSVINQDRIVTGWIRKILVREEKLFFLVTSKICRRTSFRYFQSTETRAPLEIISVDSLKSFKPLIPRGNESSYVFFLCGKLVDDETG